jgi:hypothetical protein
VAPHLHVPHRLPHDPVYDVAHPQRLRDHLNVCACMGEVPGNKLSKLDKTRREWLLYANAIAKMFLRAV